jgi:hypothetical protein
MARVRLENGPLDNVFGYYDVANDMINVDIVESLLEKRGRLTPEGLSRVLKRIVAHEARHLWQRRKFGWLIIVDRILVFLCFLAFFCLYLFYPCLILVGQLFSLGFPLALLVIPCPFLLYLVVRITINLCWSLSSYWTLFEWDARRFASGVEDDPDWKRVIEVKIAPLRVK